MSNLYRDRETATAAVCRVSFALLATLIASSRSYAFEPAPIDVGFANLTPTLRSELSYMDNVLRAADDEIDSWILRIAPGAELWLRDDFNTYSLSYELEGGTYFDSDEDDYTDHLFKADLHHEFTSRHLVDIRGEFEDGHEERGTGLTEGDIATLVDEPVEFESGELGGQYTFGGRNAPAGIELEATFRDLEYQNLREFTAFHDRDEMHYRGTFLYSLGPHTNALAEVRYLDTDYDSDRTRQPGNPGSLDSEEIIYVLGLRWEATAKTSGSLKLGSYDREFKSGGRNDESGFQWGLEVEYKPRTYSTFELATSRFSQETNGVGDFIDTQEYSAAWNHRWRSNLSSNLVLVANEDDYKGVERTDDRYMVEASVDYAFRRWLQFQTGYRYEKRSSDFDSLDYDLNVLFLEFTLGL